MSARLFIICYLLTGSCATALWGPQPYEGVGKKNISEIIAQSNVSKKTFQLDVVRKLTHEGLRKKSKDMSLDEARKAKEYFVLLERDEKVIIMLERIIALTNDDQEMQSSVLELADVYTRQGDLAKAQQLYHHYTFICPGGKDIEYASYQEIMVHFWDLLSIDRDQQKTHTTIMLAKKFLKEFPRASSYLSSIHDILKTCYMNLFQHELNVIHHYVAKYSYSNSEQTLIAATKRFEYVQEELIPYLRDYDIRFSHLEEQMKTILAEISPKTETAEISPQENQQPQRLITAQVRMTHLEFLINNCTTVIQQPLSRPPSTRF
jgi:outer membrane protein assembly factor BamD (BamD/ComL family)